MDSNIFTTFLLNGAISIALSACSTNDTGSMSNSSMGWSGTTTDSSASSMGGTSGNSNKPSPSMAIAYGVVQAIDQLSRGEFGVDSIGGAAVGGSLPEGGVWNSFAEPVGNGNGSDRLYRIHVRMDDGSSKIMAQETQPTYHIGDRVRMSNGMIQPY